MTNPFNSSGVQQIIVEASTATQKIIVEPNSGSIRIIQAGPIGPSGVPGLTGPPGPPGSGSGIVSVTGTAPIVMTGTSTAPNVTLGSLDAAQTTSGIFATARLGSGTANADAFLRGDSTWSDDVPLQIAVKNTSSDALTKGTPVYATGTVGATAVIEIAKADASTSTKMPAIGLLMQDLAVNGTGLVMIMGTITGLATTGYNINSGMFVAPGGGLTNTRPTAATDLVQNVARVTRVHANTGSVMVLGPGRTNDVPNLINTNFLATSGTASATTFLRGDQSWNTAVTSVTGTAPIVSSGSTTTPAISISAATTSAAGSMSSSDKTILDNLNTGYKVISKQTISVATANFDINPTGYSLIRIVIMGKGDINTANTANFRVTINSSISSDYCNNGSAATTVFSPGSFPGSLTNTNRMGYWDCDFVIGGVDKYTVGVARSLYFASNAAVGTVLGTNTMYYTNVSAAITSIAVRLNGSNFASGTQIIVLGVV